MQNVKDDLGMGYMWPKKSRVSSVLSPLKTKQSLKRRNTEHFTGLGQLGTPHQRRIIPSSSSRLGSSIRATPALESVTPTLSTMKEERSEIEEESSFCEEKTHHSNQKRLSKSSMGTNMVKTPRLSEPGPVVNGAPDARDS